MLGRMHEYVMKQIIIFFSLIFILLLYYKVYALSEIDIDEDHFLTEEINEFENKRVVKDIEPSYYVDIGLVTEANCDDIKWTVEGQTHHGVLDCNKRLIFSDVSVGATYSTIVEGCNGGRFEGYLEVGYDDATFIICPNQLQTTHCCPEGKGSSGSYFCDECSEKCFLSPLICFWDPYYPDLGCKYTCLGLFGIVELIKIATGFCYHIAVCIMFSDCSAICISLIP